jgi:hypothetical protein
MISRRKCFYPAEARIFEATREHDMAIDPVPSNDERGKTHSDVKRNPGFLREHSDGPVFPGDAQDLIEDRSHGRRFSCKMGRKRGASTGVRLISVRELAAAFQTAPHGGTRWWIVRSAA